MSDAAVGAAAEARSAGDGGIAAVVRATGISESTVLRGLEDLDSAQRPAPGECAPALTCSAFLSEPGLEEDLERLVDPVTRGIRSRRCGGRRVGGAGSPRRSTGHGP